MMASSGDPQSHVGGLASDVVFTGCDGSRALQMQSQDEGRPQRRVVTVNGRRIKTVDIHAHCVVPEAMALMGQAFPSERAPAALSMAQDRWRDMDAQGIDVAALSINPTWYRLERDLAAQVVAIQNDKLAAVCATQPERFVAFATVALQYPDLAVSQLEHAVKKLGLRGVAVGANVAGADFAVTKFHPFWAKAEELGALIFIHSGIVPELAARVKGNGALDNVIGVPLETTIALSHLIFEGTLDRFPGLKICSAHGGGYLPFYCARSDRGYLTFPDRCDPAIKLKKKPSDYLRQLYFDSLVFTPDALRYLASQVGASQIMMGTDYPFPWQSAAVDHILTTPDLTDNERAAILGDTAIELLGLT